MNWAKALIIAYFVVETLAVITVAVTNTPVRYRMSGAIATTVTHVVLIVWVATA